MGAYPGYETIRIENDDGVTTVTLNRPEKKNAISPAMSTDMVDALDRLRFDKTTDVLVFTGAGDSFCAGMDLKETFVDLKDKPLEWDRTQALAQEWRGQKLRMFPKPTIAAVNGWCFGGGIPVAAGCDLAIAAEEATFGIPEINFGSIPAGPVTKVVGELMRPRDALYYIMTGKPFDGRKAAEMGLVNQAGRRAPQQEPRGPARGQGIVSDESEHGVYRRRHPIAHEEPGDHVPPARRVGNGGNRTVYSGQVPPGSGNL